jgi:hypothetical protein
VVAWVPGHLGLIRLDRELSEQREELKTQCEQCTTLRAQIERLQQAAAHDQARPAWLAQRDRHGVFDSLAEAFRDVRVSIERLTLDEPGLYAAVSRSSLLACERITVDCTGDYAGLAVGLDRVAALDLPIRISRLSWGQAGSQLRLSLELEVPFVPDESLRVALADDAGLVEEDE